MEKCLVCLRYLEYTHVCGLVCPFIRLSLVFKALTESCQAPQLMENLRTKIALMVISNLADAPSDITFSTIVGVSCRRFYMQLSLKEHFE